MKDAQRSFQEMKYHLTNEIHHLSNVKESQEELLEGKTRELKLLKDLAAELNTQIDSLRHEITEKNARLKKFEGNTQPESHVSDTQASGKEIPETQLDSLEEVSNDEEQLATPMNSSNHKQSGSCSGNKNSPEIPSQTNMGSAQRRANTASRLVSSAPQQNFASSNLQTIQTPSRSVEQDSQKSSKRPRTYSRKDGAQQKKLKSSRESQTTHGKTHTPTPSGPATRSGRKITQNQGEIGELAESVCFYI
jgi:hypothetical protein